MRAIWKFGNNIVMIDHITHITRNGKYYISTNNVPFTGWETMVFPRNPSNGTVDFSEDLYAERYSSREEALNNHNLHVVNWESKP